MEPSGQPAPVTQPARPMVPVMAEAVAVPAGGAARTTAPAAAPWTNPAAFNVLESEPEPVVSAAPHEAPAGVPVCPFLGFKNDPSTRCDFADPRNVCHAASAPGAASSAFPRRLIPGKAGSTRSQEIGASHQSSLCLTTAHEQCARYPAVQALPVVAAN